MSRRLVNATLITSVGLLVASGIAGWVLPDTAASPLYAVHRVGGVALVIALVWKYGMAARSLRRRLGRDRSVAVGLLAASALALCLVLGIAWSLGVVSYDRPIPYSPLNLHVFAGLALLPLVVWHALARVGPHNTGPLASRRDALRLFAALVAAAALVPISDLVAARRRHTGSRHAGSFSGNDFPVTIWQFDQVPTLDARAWSLEVAGLGAPARLAYADLAALPQRDLDAVIDCTGGWWSEQRWRGPDLGALLRERGASGSARVHVVSVTGHRWEFAADELAGALLATHVGGEPLSPAHGYPVRLVVPGRRGFQWVKWVARVEVAGQSPASMGYAPNSAPVARASASRSS